MTAFIWPAFLFVVIGGVLLHLYVWPRGPENIPGVSPGYRHWICTRCFTRATTVKSVSTVVCSQIDCSQIDCNSKRMQLEE